jgi:hypothetical protein
MNSSEAASKQAQAKAMLRALYGMEDARVGTSHGIADVLHWLNAAQAQADRFLAGFEMVDRHQQEVGVRAVEALTPTICGRP